MVGYVFLFFLHLTYHMTNHKSHVFSGINVPPANFTAFQSAAEALQANFTASSLVPPVPSGVLSGSGAAASAAPGPLTGSVVGVAAPTGSASVSAPSGSGGSSGTGSGSAPGPTTSPSAAGMASVASVGAVVLALFGSVITLM